jgi:hypothetical protein
MMLFTNLPNYQLETSIASPNYSISTTNSLNDSRIKIKLKKDAFDFVDCAREYQVDPKYKTELCKSFTEAGFCAYGNKCRFAHGKAELFDKTVNCKKYKQKECLSFFKNKYCCYGSRCHFKHEERKLPEIERSYHTILLALYSNLSEAEVENMPEEDLSLFNPRQTRLTVFRKDKNSDENCKSKYISSMRYLNNLENYNDETKFTLSYNMF